MRNADNTSLPQDPIGDAGRPTANAGYLPGGCGGRVKRTQAYVHVAPIPKYRKLPHTAR